MRLQDYANNEVDADLQLISEVEDLSPEMKIKKQHLWMSLNHNQDDLTSGPSIEENYQEAYQASLGPSIEENYQEAYQAPLQHDFRDNSSAIRPSQRRLMRKQAKVPSK